MSREEWNMFLYSSCKMFIFRYSTPRNVPNCFRITIAFHKQGIEQSEHRERLPVHFRNDCACLFHNIEKIYKILLGMPLSTHLARQIEKN